ncbi:hypothetical protein L7F22_041173 [Adiantum nelumboides]|nr:hypothetical protein [Adiantum nelumboides]
MKAGGETVALSTNNSFGLAGEGYGGFGSMLSGNMVSSLTAQLQGRNTPSAPGLSLAPPVGSEGGMLATMMESDYGAKQKENESDSKSSSENMEGASGEEHEVAANPRPTKKRYHRHTLHQIQEMERVFKECPHPDEKQRQLLSKELNLSTRQIKFWFQNKRTQMKAHHERQDNSVLRKENEKLKAENFALRDAVRNVSCPNCGGPANLAEMSFEEQQLRIENVRLREEIERITAMAAKYVGGGGRQAQLPPFAASSPTPTGSPLDAALQVPLPTTGVGVAEPTVAEIAARPFGLTEAEKPLVVELAVASMEELLQVAQAGEPLWIAGGSQKPGAPQVMDQEVYLQRFPRGIGPTPPGLTSETSRHAGLVIMNVTSLVESFMDANRWAAMFSSIVSRVRVVEVLSTGIAGTYDGAIQLVSELINSFEYEGAIIVILEISSRDAYAERGIFLAQHSNVWQRIV